MSESIARKVQPFTIGTKLSTPAVPKSPADFIITTHQSYHLHPPPPPPPPQQQHQQQKQQHHHHHPQHHHHLHNTQHKSLDNRAASRNLNEGVCLYLSRSQVCRTATAAATTAAAATDTATLGPLSPAAVSPPAVRQTRTQTQTQTQTQAAAVVAITISASRDSSQEPGTAVSGRLPRGCGKASPSRNTNNNNNNNNNNKVTAAAKPPDTQMPAIVGVTSACPPGSEAKGGESRVRRQHLHNNGPSSSPVSVHGDCFARRNALFNEEVLQAEAWVERKSRELEDADGQCCPLQGGEEEASRARHRDLEDFENTLAQLNQTGEQLICKLNPAAELLRKQLSQLRDDWQTLRQTAANQARGPPSGGSRTLQEFNRKEAEQTLANILAENVDKMQLTRRILDFKQLNLTVRMVSPLCWFWWLKVQVHLKNRQENLQLALEASSFYHQADDILLAVHNVRKSLSEREAPEAAYGDREIRDIASQIMMLDVTVSQLSNLHPALAAGVSRKQSEVKDFWAALQRALR
ncbi:hypothetical protein CRUP_036672 [Coryphaenoides rupestris]|nr:hypothetical protein CRUP_036672 [Coryphaenoides rupestris]